MRGPGFVLQQCHFPRLGRCFASKTLLFSVGFRDSPGFVSSPPVLHWGEPALSPPGGGGPAIAVPGSPSQQHTLYVAATRGTRLSTRVRAARAGRRHAAPHLAPGRAAGSRPAPRSGAGAPVQAPRARALCCTGPSGCRACPQTSDVIAAPDSGPLGAT